MVGKHETRRPGEKDCGVGESVGMVIWYELEMDDG